MYETTLAATFVLIPGLHIVLAPILDTAGNQRRTKDGTPRFCAKLPNKEQPPTTDNSLSRKLRAELYLANMIFSQESRFRRYKTVPGLEHLAAPSKVASNAKQVCECEKAIGDKWSYVVRDTKSFSGLSVADLAQLLHPVLFQWYVTIYSIQSGMTHGASALMHLKDIDDDKIVTSLLSDDDEIHPVLECATRLYLMCFALMVDTFGFGAVASHSAFQNEADLLYAK